ncbi:hypothetical protein AAG906_039945 [Vitis piasezkii]
MRWSYQGRNGRDLIPRVHPRILPRVYPRGILPVRPCVTSLIIIRTPIKVQGWKDDKLYHDASPNIAPSFLANVSTLASSVGSRTKMSTPSRSRSTAMGDESYFDWRASMEIRQQESERQVQALLQETRRLEEENDVLRIQVSSSGPPRSRQPRSQSSSAYHAQQDESSNSTHVLTKRRRDRKSQLSDAMREAYPGPLTVPIITYWLSHLPTQQPVEGLTNRGPLGFSSRRLDDMLSTPFTPDIINYEPPTRGMMRICKVFPPPPRSCSLMVPPSSMNFIDNFRDLSEAFMGQYLCSARHKQNINTL